MTLTARRAPTGVIFGLLAASVMGYALLQSMSIPTLPLVRELLDANQNQASWIITAQLLAAAVATPIIGRLGDAFGKNRMLVASVLLLSIGSLLAAVANSIEIMILARAVQGMGGGVIPLAFGIARDEMPERWRAMAISTISSLMAVGFGVGIVVAGPIVDAVGIHWLFVLPGVVTALAALAAAIFIPTSPVRSVGGVSFMPAVLLGAWLTALLVGVSQAPSWGWTSARVIGLLSLAVLLAVLWALSERRAKAPVIDLDMMRRRAVWAPNLVALFAGFAMYAHFGFIPQLVQTPSESGYGLGLSVTAAGLVMLPGAAASFLAGLSATPLASLFGSRAVVLVSCLLASAGVSLNAFVHDTAVLVAVGVMMTSFGIGFVFALLSNLAVAAVPAHQSGVASGMNANLRTLGGAIGSAVVTSIVTAQVTSNGFAQEVGYTISFALLGIILVASALFALLIPASPKRGTALPEQEAPESEDLSDRAVSVAR